MLTKKTYSNGLRLLSVSMPAVKSVTVLVLVGVGGRYESEKTNGLAHFYEHMLFQGTKNYPSKMDLGIAVDSIGAEYNGWVDKEYTAYYVKCESSKVETAVKVLADLICNPLMKETEIEAERNVILQEIAMREDNPQVKAVDTLWESVFRDHPLGLAGAGEQKIVMSLKKRDFLKFGEKHYTAGNMVVVFSGGYEDKRIDELTDKYFGKLLIGEKNTFIPFPDKQIKFRQKIVNKKIEQAHVVLGFPGYSRISDKKYAQSLLDVILGSGFSSRLFQKIREELRLAYYIGSESESYMDTGIFACFAGLDKKKVKEGLGAIWEELNNVKRNTTNVTREELRKAKDFLRGHLILKLEEPLDLATFYGIREILEKKTEEADEILEKVEKVTIEEIMDIAASIFKPEKASLVVVGENIDVHNIITSGI